MSFIKLDRYYINLDHLHCIEEKEEVCHVFFKGFNQDYTVAVKKDSEDYKTIASYLCQCIETRHSIEAMTDESLIRHKPIRSA